MFVDSHCHLSFPELRARLPQLLQDMQAAQVRAALCICTTMEEFPQVLEVADQATNLWATVGVHPDNEGVVEPDVAMLCAAARSTPKVIALGETGLDYYRLNGRTTEDMAWQRSRFRVHLQAAHETGLPVIVHTRAASADTLAMLREEAGQGRITGVFHCFTETVEVARAALDLGFYISLSGIVTFRNAEDLRTVARMVPTDRLLIETDSPYLAPMPHRGKTNQPAWVAHVAEELAKQRGLTAEEVGLITTRNFEALFRVNVPLSGAVAGTAGQEIN
jgi:TatD DNase family protein